MPELKEVIIVALAKLKIWGKYKLPLFQLKGITREMKLFLHSFRYSEDNYKRAAFRLIVKKPNQTVLTEL